MTNIATPTESEFVPSVHPQPGSPEFAALEDGAQEFTGFLMMFIAQRGRKIALDVLFNMTAVAIIDLEVTGITDRPMDNFVRLCAEHRKKARDRKDAT